MSDNIDKLPGVPMWEDKIRFSKDQLETLLYLKQSTEKNSCTFTNSFTVLSSIGGMYFLNEHNTAKLAFNYMVSCFSMEYLAVLHEIMLRKYNFEMITVLDFTSSSKMEELKERYENIREDVYPEWVIKKCLPELNKIFDDYTHITIKDVIKVGNIVDLGVCQLHPQRIEGEELTLMEIHEILLHFRRRLKNLCRTDETLNETPNETEE